MGAEKGPQDPESDSGGIGQSFMGSMFLPRCGGLKSISWGNSASPRSQRAREGTFSSVISENHDPFGSTATIGP